MLTQISLDYNGRIYLGLTRPELRAAGVPDSAITAAEAEAEHQAGRRALRSRIAAQIADADSMAGSNADILHHLIRQLAAFSTALATATTLAEIRATAALLQHRFASLPAQLPFEAKEAAGAGDQVAEALARAAALADLLTPPAGGGGGA